MAFQLPSPPPDSYLWTDEDDLGRPLLFWQPPADGRRWLYALFFGLGLCAWASLGLSIFLGALGTFRGPNWSFGLGLTLWILAWFGGLVLMARYLLGLLCTPEPEHLLFEPDRLSYVASGPVLVSDTPADGAQPVFPPARYVEEIPREAIEAIAGIQLDRDGERQRLIIRHGESVVEIGRGLREPEREWLAGVVRAWAEHSSPAPRPPRSLPSPHPGDPVPPAVPVPPAQSWIVVDRVEPGGLRLHWLPYPERQVTRARGRELLFRLQQGAGWLAGMVLFGGLWLGMATRFLCGGGTEGISLALGVAFLGVLVDVLILAGVVLVLRFRGLLCPYRPESLTLTPAGLI
jgi:hypothetical protein